MVFDELIIKVKTLFDKDSFSSSFDEQLKSITSKLSSKSSDFTSSFTEQFSSINKKMDDVLSRFPYDQAGEDIGDRIDQGLNKSFKKRRRTISNEFRKQFEQIGFKSGQGFSKTFLRGTSSLLGFLGPAGAIAAGFTSLFLMSRSLSNTMIGTVSQARATGLSTAQIGAANVFGPQRSTFIQGETQFNRQFATPLTRNMLSGHIMQAGGNALLRRDELSRLAQFAQGVPQRRDPQKAFMDFYNLLNSFHSKTQAGQVSQGVLGVNVMQLLPSLLHDYQSRVQQAPTITGTQTHDVVKFKEALTDLDNQLKKLVFDTAPLVRVMAALTNVVAKQRELFPTEKTSKTAFGTAFSDDFHQKMAHHIHSAISPLMHGMMDKMHHMLTQAPLHDDNVRFLQNTSGG